MADLTEEDICLLVQVFPTRTRDFIFHTVSRNDDPTIEILHPMELLGLDLAASILERVKTQRPSLALVLSLCRLLVPCLEYRGNRRHLVVEEWSDLDLRGDTMFEDTRAVLSRELAAEQARDYHVITTGEEPPEDSLAEIFWDAHTELPDLADEFEDPVMSNFMTGLYHDLVPPGSGRETVRTSRIRSTIMRHWRENFQHLEVLPPVRQRRRVFKRILAATVRLASQLNCFVAKALVFKRLGAHRRPRDEETLSREEAALLELRYGGSRALRDINLGLLFGCGPLFADLVNDFAFAHIAGVPQEERDDRRQILHQYIDLLGRFRRRRKAARAAERRRTRLRHSDRLPGGRREDSASHQDRQTVDPSEQAVQNEEWRIAEAILPRLKPRDARRLKAFLDARGSYRHAAEELGMDRETFARQWRQTVKKNVRQAISEVASGEGFAHLLNEGPEDGAEEVED